MSKKIFALVMVISVLGAFLAGCSKGEDTSSTAGATAGSTAGSTTTGK